MFDTVGTLGVPDLAISGVKLFSQARREYSFVNTETLPNVSYAYQALALDEARHAFSPTVWESPGSGRPTDLKLLKQCWFPGVHSSIGGGYADASIADISLAWMITQLRRHLSFSADFVLEQQKQNEQYYLDNQLPVEPWAMGQIKRSDAGLVNTLTGRQARTPGEYHATDAITGKQLPRKLTNTCEFMHPSVRYRIQQQGPGLVTSATSAAEDAYSPAALKDWVYFAPHQPWREHVSISGDAAEKWDAYGKWVITRSDGVATFIVEERVEGGSDEMRLIEAWPGVAVKLQQTWDVR